MENLQKKEQFASVAKNIISIANEKVRSINNIIPAIVELKLKKWADTMGYIYNSTGLKLIILTHDAYIQNLEDKKEEKRILMNFYKIDYHVMKNGKAVLKAVNEANSEVIDLGKFIKINEFLKQKALSRIMINTSDIKEQSEVYKEHKISEMCLSIMK